MAEETQVKPYPGLIDKKEVQRIMDEVNARMGFVPDPTTTAEKAREGQRASGIRAEDNAATRELMQMRYGDNWEETE